MSHDRRTGRISRGLTLFELLAAVAISALLASLGWPLLTRQRAAAAVSAATNQTLAALQSARQLALATGHSVTVCPSPDGRRCGFGAGHWMLFENLPGGRDAARESGEPMRRRWQLPAGVLASGSRGHATYQPVARSAATLTFRFCHRGVPQAGQSVIVSQTGRPRVTRLNPGDCTR